MLMERVKRGDVHRGEARVFEAQDFVRLGTPMENHDVFPSPRISPRL